ncbi:Protein of unknown function UPF0301 [Macleaya cordata]|uniref:Uncharacterized protein n=1 Tax=Macleaya cordata TaxID=56857 RepID=A0A200QNA2_MACCD|nr:Protein of unknown function UPF0301 [Macleaya cordata]
MSTKFIKSTTLLYDPAANYYYYNRHSNKQQQQQQQDGNIFPIITCCDIRSSREDNNGPSIKADWRSFRASLVASERTAKPEESSNWSDPRPIEDNHPRVTNGKKWAHILHEPEKGCLLVATKKLDGVNIFKGTAILLLLMDPTGPTGIILNRPSSLRETRSTVPDVEEILFDMPLYFGGPIDEKLVLVGPRKGDAEEVVRRSGVFEEVMEGLYYGTKEESVSCAAEMVKSNEVEVEDFRVFEGHCLWENLDKLKEEIRSGYWNVIACSPSIIGMG